jgi:hypothetical protein
MNESNRLKYEPSSEPLHIFTWMVSAYLVGSRSISAAASPFRGSYQRLQGLRLGLTVWGLRSGVWGFGVHGLGFEVWGLGLGFWGLGYGVQGLEPPAASPGSWSCPRISD